MPGRLLIVFLLQVALVSSCAKSRERIKPVYSVITESVYASAVVKAVNQYTAFSIANGILKEIKVKPGDKVVEGQVLFVLDNNTAGLSTQSSRLSLELSEENSRKTSDKLQELDLSRRLAYDKYLLDSSLYIRQKLLWEQNVGTRVDFDQRRLAYIASKNNYEAAIKRYNQMELGLKNEWERAKINYNISRKVEDNFIVRSKIAGEVFDVLIEKGELIATQTPLAILGRSNQFILEMQVDENDITRIKPGQLVQVTMDSSPEQVFEAKVLRIYPIMNERTRTFQVDASFTHPPSSLYPNLTAEANVVIKTKNDAIVIPRDFLVDDQYVWTSKNEKKRVKTGLRDYRKVEIVEGLDTTEFIYKP
jgi:HlyD family secretion protein